MGTPARASNQRASPARDARPGRRRDAQTDQLPRSGTARGRREESRDALDAGPRPTHRKAIGRPSVVEADGAPPRSGSSPSLRSTRSPRSGRSADDTPTRKRRAVSGVAPTNEPNTAPHLTLPTVPRVSAPGRPSDAAARPDVRRHRTLLGGRRAERALRAVPDVANDPWDEESWTPPDWREASGPSQSRLPALADAYPEQDALSESSGRLRDASDARPLPPRSRRARRMVARVLTAEDGVASMAVSTASVPDLVAYRPPRVRPRVDTRAIIESARSPWSLTRICLAFLAMVLAIVTTATVAGESPQPLMFYQAAAGAGPAGDIAWPVNAITAKVQPATQLRRTDLYDSVDQFNLWGGAACSAAALSEVLTAYGVPNATIGRMIDELGSDISPDWGLLTYDGFAKVAAAHGLRADNYVDKLLTYPQMQYLTNTLGIPVIVNVRISYGYYHFFSGGHFMVMTYGDDQGVRLVDSSLYYVKYLPMDVFHSMFTGRTAVIVPKDMQYTLPT